MTCTAISLETRRTQRTAAIPWAERPRRGSNVLPPSAHGLRDGVPLSKTAPQDPSRRAGIVNFSARRRRTLQRRETDESVCSYPAGSVQAARVEERTSATVLKGERPWAETPSSQE